MRCRNFFGWHSGPAQHPVSSSSGSTRDVVRRRGGGGAAASGTSLALSSTATIPSASTAAIAMEASFDRDRPSFLQGLSRAHLQRGKFNLFSFPSFQEDYTLFLARFLSPLGIQFLRAEQSRDVKETSQFQLSVFTVAVAAVRSLLVPAYRWEFVQFSISQCSRISRSRLTTTRIAFCNKYSNEPTLLESGRRIFAGF